MVACCAYGCSNSSEKGLKMYSVPRGKNEDDKIRRQIWLQRINRAPDNLPIYPRLCEVHFEHSQFEPKVPGKLKKNAIPSLFPDPALVENPRKKGPKETNHALVENSRKKRSKKKTDHDYVAPDNEIKNSAPIVEYIASDPLPTKCSTISENTEIGGSLKPGIPTIILPPGMIPVFPNYVVPSNCIPTGISNEEQNTIKDMKEVPSTEPQDVDNESLIYVPPNISDDQQNIINDMKEVPYTEPQNVDNVSLIYVAPNISDEQQNIIHDIRNELFTEPQNSDNESAADFYSDCSFFASSDDDFTEAETETKPENNIFSLAIKQNQELATYRRKYKNVMSELSRLRRKIAKLRTEKKEFVMEQKKSSSSLEHKTVDEIKKLAEEGDIKAIFLYEQILQFKKVKPRWSEDAIRFCFLWKKSCPTGYEYVRDLGILTLPPSSRLNNISI